MRLLLDTHIWLWSLQDPGRLSRRAVRELASQRNERWLSPLSIWEALLLAERGRLRVAGSRSRWIERMLAVSAPREAVLTRAVVMESDDVQLSHRDPVDRFLVATARSYGLTLVTADRRLVSAAACPVLPG